MKKREIKIGLAIIAVLYIVIFLCIWKTNLVARILEDNPFGIFDEYHMEKGNQDLEKGREYTIAYVKEKYGFEPEITNMSPLMAEYRSDLSFKQKYTGKVLSECCVNGEYFNTIIRISDRAGCDDYQKEEIMDRIKTEVQKQEGLKYEYVSYSYQFMSESEAHHDKAEEYYDENTDLKEFLKPLNFRMDLRSDIDLEEIDCDALYRMFPEEGVYIYKPFPEGEEWDCFGYQQTLEYVDTKIRKYAPKLVAGAEVSACDASDFTVEKGIILQGEWEGPDWLKIDPVEAPVYTCQFGEFKEVELGLPEGWKEKEGIDLPEGADRCMYYQYRDETGIIRNNYIFGERYTKRIYTDMLTITYAKMEK